MTIKDTTQQLPINPPLLIAKVSGCTSWDEWLEKTEASLKELGYWKYNQNFKNEDFAYWKSFDINENKAYQVGLFFYDFRKYQNQFNIAERIGVQFECMFIDIDGRIDLTVSKNITLEQFEIMAQTFYSAMFQYCQ
jgi:hypothetical protein